MAREPARARPRSLVDHFEPPEGFVGSFGWVCGYSADAAFMERATERFTHLTAPRRAFEGKVVLSAMLDPGNAQISPVDVPGMLHLPVRGDVQRNFALLHAKVALLAFNHERDAEHWYLRLIVSTGNWTRQTLEESLDLAWRVDLARGALSASDDSVRQARVDIGAAAEFLEDLRKLFDARALASGSSRGGEVAVQRFDRWVGEAGVTANGQRSRFFDSRRKSLLDQLPERIALVSSKEVARNYLAMGSGFYESARSTGQVPSVLKQVVDRLQGNSGGPQLLTSAPEVNVFVNPQACQGVAALSKNLPRRWSVRLPYPKAAPDWRRRALHAKFIFSANWRQGSEHCASAWLYLGSGNLTHPGFTSAAHRDRGNLEAGVVVNAEDLRWRELSDHLPVGELDGESDLKIEDLAAGEDMEERQAEFFAPPVACLKLVVEQGANWLQPLDDQATDFSVIDPDGNECRRSERGFEWLAAPPRQVRIRWRGDDETREVNVPVIDSFGRVAGAALQKLDLSGVWAQLSDFPLPPPEDELEDADQPSDAVGVGVVASTSAASASAPGGYVTRELMTLIENIAALQDQLKKADWPTWCGRLEQTLTLAGDCPTAEYCRGFGINLLSPLRRPEFRPTFAQDESTAEGQSYNEALARIERAWRVDTLPQLGQLGDAP